MAFHINLWDDTTIARLGLSMPVKGQVPGKWAGAVGWPPLGRNAVVAAFALPLLLGGCRYFPVYPDAGFAEAAGPFPDNYVEIAKEVAISRAAGGRYFVRVIFVSKPRPGSSVLYGKGWVFCVEADLWRKPSPGKPIGPSGYKDVVLIDISKETRDVTDSNMNQRTCFRGGHEIKEQVNLTHDELEGQLKEAN